MTTLDWIAFIVMPLVAVAIGGIGVLVFQRWMRDGTD